MKFKVACQEANHFCDKSQYKEAGFWEKVKLATHLLYCKACRSYSKKNVKLSKIVKEQDLRYVTPAEKKVLKHRINKEIAASKNESTNA